MYFSGNPPFLNGSSYTPLGGRRTVDISLDRKFDVEYKNKAIFDVKLTPREKIEKNAAAGHFSRSSTRRTRGTGWDF